MVMAGPPVLTRGTSSDREKNPAQVCASYDLGGGVGLADSFVIHTIATFTPNWDNLKDDPKHCAELTAAASKIADILPVCISLGESTTFCSLPYPQRTFAPDQTGKTQTHPLDNPPWFLVNAAISKKHCVVGQNSALESLLMILQQPWCVLEICCCNTETLTAVHGFSTIAEKIYHGSYAIAVWLLSHEMTRRAGRTPDSAPWWPCKAEVGDEWAVPGPILADVRAIYAELFSSGRRSRNPFWLCLVAVCAVFLDVAFSDLARCLFDDVRYRAALTGCHSTMATTIVDAGAKGNTAEESHRTVRFSDRSMPPRTRLKRSMSESSLQGTAGRPTKKPFSTAGKDGDYHRRLFLLHARILKKIQESIP